MNSIWLKKWIGVGLVGLLVLHQVQADTLCDDEVRAKSTFGSTKATLLYVHDGDTIKVNISGFPSLIGEGILVRLLRMDAPEITSHHPLIKPLAKRITEYVTMRCKNAKTIWLQNMQRDKYFRILAEVWVDGYNISDRLIELGFGLPYNGGTKKSWEEVITPALAKALNAKLDQVMKSDAAVPKINTVAMDALFAKDSCYAR